MRIDVDTQTSGPLFDGRALQALRDFVDEAPYEIAEKGTGIYLGVLHPQLKAPTGYLESQVRAERVAFATSRIWDGGVIYSWWIEGVGSRNFPVTRFRGYASYRKATPAVQAQAVPTAEALLRRRYLSRMQ